MSDATENTFEEKPQPKGRTVAVQLTEAQESQFNYLKTQHGITTDAGLLKKALSLLVNDTTRNPPQPPAPDTPAAAEAEAESYQPTPAEEAQSPLEFESRQN